MGIKISISKNFLNFTGYINISGKTKLKALATGYRCHTRFYVSVIV